jgi:tetratricopeptide (TPR) repeat protein
VLISFLVYCKRDRFDEAKDEFIAAARLDPGDGDAHANLGLAYFYQGRLEEAANEFNVALSLDPELAKAHDFLEICYKRMKISQ